MQHSTMRNAFPIVAAALGNKMGINVLVKGTEACTNGNVIVIPSYDGNDPGYKTVAWGFLAHEAAHIRFTDFTTASRVTSKFRFSILNILEDIRIELLMNALYPGTRYSIEKTMLHMIANGDFAPLSQGDSPAKVLHDYMLFRLRFDVLGQTAFKDHAEQAESILESTFPAGMVTRLAGLLTEVPSFKTTQDALILTDRILNMIREEDEKEQERQKQKSSKKPDKSKDPAQGSDDDSDPDKSDDPAQGSDDDSKPDDSGDPSQGSDGDSKPDDSGDHAQGSDGDSKPDDSGDPAQGSDDDSDPDKSGDPAQGSDDDSDTDKSDDPAQGSDGDADQDKPGDPAQGSGVLRRLLDSPDTDVPEDIMDAAKKLLSIAAQGDSGITLPVPQTPIPEGNGNALLSKALLESGKLSTAMHGIIQSERMARVFHKDYGTRINDSRLDRLACGDTKVFRHKVKKAAPNTAIHLLVDRSPSMNRQDLPGATRYGLAVDACLSLALSLQGIPGVNPGISSFPGYASSPDHVVQILRHGWPVRHNVSNFTISADEHGSTPLTQALWFAASSLLACKEERKILIVLTDGAPDDPASALEALARCRASGIEDIGIGIYHDVKHLFKVPITINNIAELRGKIFQISRELLVA